MSALVPGESVGASADESLLERRIKREREARKAAEQLLNSKSLELYEALQQSAHAQRLLELALWASGESIWEWSSGQDEILIRSFPNTDGPAVISRGSITRFTDHVHPDDLSDATLRWRMMLNDGAQELDIAVRYIVGHDERWMRVRGKVVEFGADRAPSRAVGTVKDITAHREAEHSFRLMASAFAGSRDAMVVLTEDHEIIEVNRAFQRLMREHQSARDPIGMQLSEYLQIPGQVNTSFGETGFGLCESDFKSQDDATTPVEVSLSRVAGANGRTSYLIATIRDITERKRAENALERMARHDALTALPNRSTLQQRLALQLLSLKHQIAVMFLDLDGFKEVNDSLGHEAGDEVLKEMARRLQSKLGPDDMLARWGGDEFVMMVPLRDGASRASRLAQHMLNAMRERIEVRGHEISVSGSIGIAIAPSDGRDTETLLRHADAAMYAAKNAGKNRMALYHPGLTADALHNVILITELRTAIEQGKLHFVMQPKFDNRFAIVGAELLARWESPLLGSVSPVIFIPLAEENGMSLQLGRLAIDCAARYAKVFAQSGWPIPISVNISALQVMDKRLETVLRQALKDHGVSPVQLELEVTESIFLQDSDAPEQRIEALRAQGFPIAMDDFGTGYSSLGYLRRLPFDTIKIDRSFLIDVDSDDKARRLLAGIVNLCTSLGIRTVAEGVETENQLTLLRRLGVDQFQGFLLGKPMPARDLLALLQRARK